MSVIGVENDHDFSLRLYKSFRFVHGLRVRGRALNKMNSGCQRMLLNRFAIMGTDIDIDTEDFAVAI